MNRKTLAGMVLGFAVFFLIGWSAQSVAKFVSMKLATTTRVFAEGAHQTVEIPMKHDATQSNCVAITGTAADFTLSTDSNYFCIRAMDNTALIRCDGSAATTTAGSGYDTFAPPGGDPVCKEITEATCSVIGTAAGGAVCFEPQLSPGGAH